MAKALRLKLIDQFGYMKCHPRAASSRHSSTQCDYPLGPSPTSQFAGGGPKPPPFKVDFPHNRKKFFQRISVEPHCDLAEEARDEGTDDIVGRNMTGTNLMDDFAVISQEHNEPFSSQVCTMYIYESKARNTTVANPGLLAKDRGRSDSPSGSMRR